jgi:hypothetical protein
MDVRTGDREETLERRKRADEVDHHTRAAGRRRAEREPEDRAEMVLELTRLRAVDRPVPVL